MVKNSIIEMVRIVNPIECQILGDEKICLIYEAMLNKQKMSSLRESEELHRFNEPLQIMQYVEMTLSVFASVLSVILSLGKSNIEVEKETLFVKAISVSLKLDDAQIRMLVKILKDVLKERNNEINK